MMGFKYGCTKSKKCCESVEKLRLKIREVNLYNPEEDKAKIEFYKTFHEKYFIPDFISLTISEDETDSQKIKKIFDQNIFLMNFRSLHEECIYYRFKCLIQYNSVIWYNYDGNKCNLRRIFDYELEYFIYPHNELKKYWKILERISTAPLNKKMREKFQQAQTMYKRIMEVNDSDEEWFQRIQEWNDEEFTLHSIEQRISENTCNKNLWKIYIEYLRPRNSKAMLGIYSRYCGYFLDDGEMKNEYLKEAQTFGIIPNEKLLDFSEFGSIKAVFKDNPKTKYFIPKLNLDIAMIQYFDFPNPIIYYLMKQHQILHKLFSSCKYFFKKQPTPICHRLVIAEDITDNRMDAKSKLENQALTIHNVTPKLKEFNNLFVTNYFHVDDSFNNNNLVAAILPCIYKFAVKYLTIEKHRISFKDFLFMTESKTVEELKFHNVEILVDSDALAQLEDIMEVLPNVHHFSITASSPFENTVAVSYNSFQKIADLPRNKLFSRFSIGLCHEVIDSTSFVQYLMKNMDKDTRAYISFHESINPDLIQQFSTSVLNQIKSVESFGCKILINNRFLH